MERYFLLDKFNTWADWNLIVTAKDVTPPEPKTNYVDIDGMSGTLDLSESLTGEIHYKDRTLTASFLTWTGTRDDRARLLREITAALHGKKIKIVEPDDPDHYFYGRVVIKSANNIIPYMEFTIEATCEPWRYAIEETKRNIVIDSEDLIEVILTNNGVKTVHPTISANSGDITVIFGDFTETIPGGLAIQFYDIKLHQGVNTIGMYGTGSVTIIYREADL